MSRSRRASVRRRRLPSDALPRGGLAPFPQWSAPRAITRGPHDHLLASYFAIDSWSPNKRYMLVLETDVNGRLPEAGERCTLGVVDMEDGNRFIPVTTTACWNFQEAAMAFWMDNDTILFNDLRDGKFKSGETYYNAYHERPWVLVRLADGIGSVPKSSNFRGVRPHKVHKSSTPPCCGRGDML